jgi:hypothetical protein
MFFAARVAVNSPDKVFAYISSSNCTTIDYFKVTLKANRRFRIRLWPSSIRLGQQKGAETLAYKAHADSLIFVQTMDVIHKPVLPTTVAIMVSFSFFQRVHHIIRPGH